MKSCITLAMCDTGSGAIDWYNTPLADLVEWTDALNEVLERRKRMSK